MQPWRRHSEGPVLDRGQGVHLGRQVGHGLQRPHQRRDERVSVHDADSAGTVNPTGPQSGYYSGFFWMKVTPPKRIAENDLHIEFVQEGSVYRVSGSGREPGWAPSR